MSAIAIFRTLQRVHADQDDAGRNTEPIANEQKSAPAPNRDDGKRGADRSKEGSQRDDPNGGRAGADPEGVRNASH